MGFLKNLLGGAKKRDARDTTDDEVNAVLVPRLELGLLRTLGDLKIVATCTSKDETAQSDGDLIRWCGYVGRFNSSSILCPNSSTVAKSANI